MNNDLIHRGFEYKIGLNVDTNPFGYWSKGLYFCDQSKCHLHWKDYGTRLALIEIPDDAKVFAEASKFRTDKLIINEIIDFDDVSDAFWINMIRNDKVGTVLKYVAYQTEELCELAVQYDPMALQYVVNQTENVCGIAVQKDGRALVHVVNQNTDICQLAVQENGSALQYVIDQTDDICKLAVQNNGLAIQYVKTELLTDDLGYLAIQQNSSAIQFARNKTTYMRLLAFKQNCYELPYDDIFMVMLYMTPYLLFGGFMMGEYIKSRK